MEGRADRWLDRLSARHSHRSLSAALLLSISFAWPAQAANTPYVRDLSTLSLEELGDVQVTSVFKRPEPLSQAPAAIYVITNAAIRRSGATSLPEALRLAPNLQVARLNSRDYAITARGFNQYELSNKLLVLIDGRSTYTPLHSGVFWDQQSVMLEDVDRIEVISGPGGTLYGANAVNGVINIITKSSRDTQGGLVSTQIGNVDRTGALRYGGKINDNLTYRGYGRGARMGDSRTPAGADANDDWEGRQLGFRSDWQDGTDQVTIQGDAFRNPLDPGITTSGGNILGRWTRRLSDSSAVELQGYYDKVDRTSPGVSDKLETLDIETQYSFQIGTRHNLVAGGGIRHNRNEFDAPASVFRVAPVEDTQQLYNVFLQDSIALSESVTLTLGNKFEYNSFTGMEPLPSGRLAWRVSDDLLLWSAVSRAVRTPSRIDQGLFGLNVDRAGDSLRSETLIAYEAGLRVQPTDDTTLSVSFFYNDYDDLRILGETTPGRLAFSNRMHGTIYGVETWGDYRVSDRWRLSAGVNYMHKDLTLEPGASRVAIHQHQGSDPDYQASLRSSLDITKNIEWDIGVRFVDNLNFPAVPGYVALDSRIGWDVTENVELSLAGFNLLDDDDGHGEIRAADVRRDIPRTVYAGLRVRF